MTKKEYLIFTILCVLVFLGGIHKFYIGTGIRYDIFLLYDYKTEGGRLMSNIIRDFSNLITRTSLLFISFYISKTKMLKRILFPFLIISIADIIDYWLFFQKNAHVKLFVLLLLILLYVYPHILKTKKK